jgi:hypothetical protein
MQNYGRNVFQIFGLGITLFTNRLNLYLTIVIYIIFTFTTDWNLVTFDTN